MCAAAALFILFFSVIVYTSLDQNEGASICYRASLLFSCCITISEGLEMKENQ